MGNFLSALFRRRILEQKCQLRDRPSFGENTILGFRVPVALSDRRKVPNHMKQGVVFMDPDGNHLAFAERSPGIARQDLIFVWFVVEQDIDQQRDAAACCTEKKNYGESWIIQNSKDRVHAHQRRCADDRAATIKPTVMIRDFLETDHASALRLRCCGLREIVICVRPSLGT